MVLAAAMIRQPAVFYVQEKPKSMQRFLVANPTSKAINDVEKTETVLETDPLLAPKKERRPSILDGIIENVKNNVPKLFTFKTKVFVETGLDETNLENEYTWWTKFYNSCKVIAKHTI